MKLVHSHTYYQINYEAAKGLLVFSWNEEHQDMSYSEFKEACSNYAGYAHEYQTKILLVDVSNFQLKLPEAFSEWQDQVHYPRFYKLGVLKMAYLTQTEWLSYMKDIPPSEGRFALKNFDSQEEALAWLVSQ